MKRINSLSDLLMEELAELLSMENQLAGVLLKMAEASQSSALKAALEDHLEVAKEHAHRLQDILGNIRQNPQGLTGEDMKGFFVESENVINKTERCPTRDASIISILQRVEQFEITKYQTAREHAADLGHTRMVEVLTETLNEERAINFHLNELAQYMINVQATNPFDYRETSTRQQSPLSKNKSGGFYIPRPKFGRGGIKKKTKNTDVSRFINKENPNIQGPQGKEKDGTA